HSHPAILWAHRAGESRSIRASRAFERAGPRAPPGARGLWQASRSPRARLSCSFRKIDPGAWLVVCSALVLLMAPALALFYAGRAPGANPKSMLIRWLVALPILAIQWVLFGYSLAFGPTRHGLIGGLAYAGMTGGITDVRGAVPAIAFAACRMMFAVIAPALISGALGARMKLGAYVAFVLFWSTLVYDPVAHWLWAHGGWLSRIGALDYGGGLAVHCTTGVAAVVCALVIAERPGDPVRR